MHLGSLPHDQHVMRERDRRAGHLPRFGADQRANEVDHLAPVARGRLGLRDGHLRLARVEVHARSREVGSVVEQLGHVVDPDLERPLRGVLRRRDEDDPVFVDQADLCRRLEEAQGGRDRHVVQLERDRQRLLLFRGGREHESASDVQPKLAHGVEEGDVLPVDGEAPRAQLLQRLCVRLRVVRAGDVPAGDRLRAGGGEERGCEDEDGEQLREGHEKLPAGRRHLTPAGVEN